MSHSTENILDLDSKIRKSLNEENDYLLTDYKEKLLNLQKNITTKHLSDTMRRDIADNIKDLKYKIDQINACDKLNLYIAETAHLLYAYKQILDKPIKLCFTGKSPTRNREKDIIIRNYIKIAKKYSNLVIKDLPRMFRYRCGNCNNKKVFEVVDGCIYICLNCGSEIFMIFKSARSYEDLERINLSKKYTYNRRVHFRDCINQYQGKQNTTIPDEVFKKLTEEFRVHHLLVDDNTVSNNIRFQNITKEHIYMFLKDLSYTKHYENVNLIHYKLTGIEPDNISHLEELLLYDFDLLTKAYDTLFKPKQDSVRKNFINIQFVLYKLLKKHNHPCKRSDFTSLKTTQIQFTHNDLCKRCFNFLGWDF